MQSNDGIAFYFFHNACVILFGCRLHNKHVEDYKSPSLAVLSLCKEKEKNINYQKSWRHTRIRSCSSACFSFY
jgi:hypothetical protein